MTCLCQVDGSTFTDMSNTYHIKKSDKPDQPLCDQSNYDKEWDLRDKEDWLNIHPLDRCIWCTSIAF